MVQKKQQLCSEEDIQSLELNWNYSRKNAVLWTITIAGIIVVILFIILMCFYFYEYPESIKKMGDNFVSNLPSIITSFLAVFWITFAVKK